METFEAITLSTALTSTSFVEETLSIHDVSDLEDLLEPNTAPKMPVLSPVSFPNSPCNRPTSVCDVDDSTNTSHNSEQS
ncbi:hypothetical protein CDAR_44321 [Caerostris darwini]|uniref:Uncharacterized protein n=1 Tax=Caerostris darwini TaxID=1538125 RepID=A0AAV4QKX6_9ARAC|nr:hypothetical protein CDAR_44321 [Caerostris darwini]